MTLKKKVIVQDFYEKDFISKVLPHKNLTKNIKLPNGEQQSIPFRVMEGPFFDAYKLFITEYPVIKVG